MNSTIQSKPDKRLKDAVCFAFGIVLIALIIQLLRWLKGDALVFPGVVEIGKAFITLLLQKATYQHLFRTLLDFVCGVLAGSFFGIALGFLGGFSKIIRSLLKPVMIALRSIPTIVMIVIIMTLAKYAHVPIITCAIAIVPLLYEATATGIESLDRSYIDVYRLESSISLSVIMRVHVPLISSFLRQALSNAIGIGIKICVICEYIVGVNGTIGKDIMNSRIQIEFANLYAYGVILIFLVLAVEAIPLLLTKNETSLL